MRPSCEEIKTIPYLVIHVIGGPSLDCMGQPTRFALILPHQRGEHAIIADRTRRLSGRDQG